MSKFPNKFVIDGVTKLDLTSDTVAPDKMVFGYTAHDASGAVITGTLADGDELEYGTEVLNDLTGTTWYFNGMLDLTNDAMYYINFTSDGATYDGLEIFNHSELDYYANGIIDFIAFNNGNWSGDAEQRTISITGGNDATNADLIAWLEANATQQ